MTTSPNILPAPKRGFERHLNVKSVAALTSLAIFGFLAEQYYSRHSDEPRPSITPGVVKVHGHQHGGVLGEDYTLNPDSAEVRKHQAYYEALQKVQHKG